MDVPISDIADDFPISDIADDYVGDCCMLLLTVSSADNITQIVEIIVHYQYTV